MVFLDAFLEYLQCLGVWAEFFPALLLLHPQLCWVTEWGVDLGPSREQYLEFLGECHSSLLCPALEPLLFITFIILGRITAWWGHTFI